jgi:hypothetical protein
MQLVRTHPIFALSYDSLRRVWALPLSEQRKLLQNSALEAKMFRLLNVPHRVGSNAAKHVIDNGSAAGAEAGSKVVVVSSGYLSVFTAVFMCRVFVAAPLSRA